MEIVIQTIKNGYVMIAGEEVVYCKDLPRIHQELAMFLGAEQELPKLEEKPSGVRQFDDED